MKGLAKATLAALTVILLAVYAPLLFDKLFGSDVKRTHLLFSPVLESFVWKEKIVGTPPEGALVKAEDHHANILYRDETGNYYSRQEFEKLLPFIYYKNMELWGLLPLELGGQSFDKATIKKSRQVLELKAADVPGQRPPLPLLPLLESNPGQARLVFPEDRYRIRNDGLEFINADFNSIDAELSQAFTDALTQAGFQFPVRLAATKPSILKPFDAGVLLVDVTGAVFQLKRVDGAPSIVRTPIDPDLGIKHIKVNENRRREFLGILLDKDSQPYLIRDRSFALVPLDLPDYDASSMDLKILLNPLYATAVYANDTTIRGVAMDRNFTPLRSYSHDMAMAKPTWTLRLRQLLFPFELVVGESVPRGYVRTSFQAGGPLSLVGMVASWQAYVRLRRRRGAEPSRASALLAGLAGIYGLIAALTFLEDEPGVPHRDRP
jgi:hypothetical protein